MKYVFLISILCFSCVHKNATFTSFDSEMIETNNYDEHKIYVNKPLQIIYNNDKIYVNFYGEQNECAQTTGKIIVKETL